MYKKTLTWELVFAIPFFKADVWYIYSTIPQPHLHPYSYTIFKNTTKCNLKEFVEIHCSEIIITLVLN